MRSLKLWLVAGMLGLMAMYGWASTDAPKDLPSHLDGKNTQATVQHSPTLPYGAHVVKTRVALSFGFFGPGPYYYGPPPYYYNDPYYYGPYYDGPYYRGYYWRRHHHRHWHHW